MSLNNHFFISTYSTVYNGCLVRNNVEITSRVHSNVKYGQQSLIAGISVLNHCLSWSNFVDTHYPTPDSGLAAHYYYTTTSAAESNWCYSLLWPTDSNSHLHL